MSREIFLKAAVIGGTSQIALSIIKNLPQLETVYLAGRNEERLRAAAGTLTVKEVKVLSGDISSGESIASLVSELPSDLDLAVIAQGMLKPESSGGTGRDLEDMVRVNLTGPCIWMDELVKKYGDRSCRICVISSVAGDRGRASNYLYGMTKAGLSAYAEGRGAELEQNKRKCRITVLKPGLVATRMTADRSDMRLAADCDSVGKTAAKALMSGKSSVYAPVWWRPVMFIIRNLPGFVFRRIRA